MPRMFLPDRPHRRASRVPAWRRGGAALACALLVVAGACGLTGCKQTDFLKKITINPFVGSAADSDAIVYNSPDAEETADWLPAFDLTDDAPITDATENIVVPTLDEDKANTDLATRHSVFDLDRVMVKGLEATDGVRLVAATKDEDTVDRSVPQDDADEEKEKSQKDASKESKSAKKSSDKKSGEEGDTSSAEKEKSSDSASSDSKTKKKESGSGVDAGEGSEGNEDSSSEGDGGSGEGGDEGDPDGWGTSAKESGGYDGSDITYDPGNKLNKPKTVDHVAAIGQAAVLVQAMAGEGALVGMDEGTYDGVEDGIDARYASSFKDVFSDELEKGFEDDCVLWSDDGLEPKDLTLKNTKKLVENLTANGTVGSIFFCSDEGSPSELFNSTQLQMFKDADIELVPIDMTSVRGSWEAAKAVGEALSEAYASGKIAQDPVENAKAYKKAVTGIVDSAKDARVKDTCIRGVVCTDFERGVTIKNDFGIDTTGGALFVDSDLLREYEVDAGLTSMYASMNFHIGVWGSAFQYDGSMVSGARADGPFAREFAVNIGGANHFQACGLLVEDANNDGNRGLNLNGLYSHYTPYLIVSGSSDGLNAAQVKKIVASLARQDKTLYTLWSGENENPNNYNGMQKGIFANIVDYGGMDLNDLIRENPCGLAGNWWEGGTESIMEVMWLTELYSKAPECKDSFKSLRYDPVNATPSFDADGDGTDEANLEESVKAFYKKFYRYDLGSGSNVDYDEVVTDNLEDGLE